MGVGGSLIYFVFSKGDSCGQIYFQRNKDNHMASQPFLTVQEAGSPLPTNVEAFSGPELGTGLLCPDGRSQGKAMAGNVASL